MELNTKAVNSLKKLSNKEILSDDEFGRFVFVVFDSYVVNLNTGAGGSLDVNADAAAAALQKLWKSGGAAELKELVAATYMLITELARNNSDKISAEFDSFYSILFKYV